LICSPPWTSITRNSERRDGRIRFCGGRNPIHVHDLHATLLHFVGFDHERLNYRYAGRDFRLTDVQGVVV
jgi:hypothetical protein